MKPYEAAMFKKINAGKEDVKGKKGDRKEKKERGCRGVGGWGERAFLLNSTIYTVRNTCGQCL
jgi:hypothetical protein